MKCLVCDTENEDGTQFCSGCGVELPRRAPADLAPQDDLSEFAPPRATPQPEEVEGAGSGAGSGGAAGQPPAEPAQPPRAGAMAASGARLVVKRYGAVTDEEIPIGGAPVIVGRFDPSSGPVDVDVTSLPSAETVSRRHAEIFETDGKWTVKDLGSSNGIFVKRAGEGSFSPRLQAPLELRDGDEVAFGNVVFVFRVQ